MHLSDLRAHLAAGRPLRLRLPNGTRVPAHAHVTELGGATRHFIDCGGTVRETRAASLQLWTSVDVHHRLEGEKLVGIIDAAGARLGLAYDLEVEVEVQGADTIARYGLAADEEGLRLVGLHTDCLALERCGVPGATQLKQLAGAVQQATTRCTPGGGCC